MGVRDKPVGDGHNHLFMLCDECMKFMHLNCRLKQIFNVNDVINNHVFYPNGERC